MRIAPSGIPVGGVAGSGVFAGIPTARLRQSPMGTATVGGDRVYYQGADARVHSCALDGSDDRSELGYPSGIFSIEASASVVAVCAGGGTTTSWGGWFKDAVPLFATADGAVLLLTSYSTGSGLRMVAADAPNGLVWDRPNARPITRYPYPQAFALDRHRVVYFDVALNRFESIGLPQPKHAAGAVDPLLVEAPDGRVWLGYHTDRFVLHPIDDDRQGYILDTGLTYGTTATGSLVGFSRDPSESEMVVRSIDWSAALVSLAPTAPTVPAALAPNVPSVAFTGFWRSNKTAPGNAAIDSLTHPGVIAGEDTILTIPKERRLGLLVYLAGSDDEALATLQRGKQFAAEHDLVAFIYDDRRAFRYPLIKPHLAGMRVVLTPQWYLRANAALTEAHETPAAFAADVIAQAKTFDGHFLMPTIRATFGGWLIPAADVVEALNELIRQGALQLPGFIGWLFWAWSRKDGVDPSLFVDDHGRPFPIPAFRDAIDLWMKTPATANPETWIAEHFPPAQVPLAITVHDFTEQGQAPFHPSARYTVLGVPAELGILVLLTLNGEIVGASDQVSGVVTTEKPITEAGEYRLGLTASSMGRKTQTGAVRIVRVLPPAPKPEIPGITYPSQPGSGRADDARRPSQEAADAAKREEGGG